MAGNGLFLTGASGFLGSRILPLLSGPPFDSIYCLSRQARSGAPDSRVRWIAGSLEAPSTYAGALRECRTVMHLAALTGKARPAAYQTANVEATRTLLEASRAAGITRFVHVSTIAATYTQFSGHYHYAASKRRAEELVMASGLRYLITRPTILLGPGSPGMAGLAKLALAPAMVLLGDGSARLQPAAVDDVTRALAELAADEQYDGGAIDLGGPEILTVKELLAAIRRAAGKPEAAAIQLPASLLIGAVAAVEGPLFPLLPMTAGQLSVLMNPALAAPHPFTASRQGAWRRVAAALSGCF